MTFDKTCSGVYARSRFFAPFRATATLRLLTLLVALSIAAPALRAQPQRAYQPTEQDLRITSLLVQLAEQARSSSSPAFAARAQSQAATILWPYDRERARAMFRKAFDSLSAPGFGESERRQLQAELLSQIAKRDSELAESIVHALAYSIESLRESNATGQVAAASAQAASASSLDSATLAATLSPAEIEQRELLIGVALQIVERDPNRAMTLSQLSLSAGVSPNFARLLMLMRASDSVLAALLFSSAVARLEQLPTTRLADIHALGSYLVLSSSRPPKEIDRAVIVRFLNLAFNYLMRHNLKSGQIDYGDTEQESAAVYFISRQLVDLFDIYLPQRVAQVKNKVAALNDGAAIDQIVYPTGVQANSPADVAREASSAASERERDELYTRSALGWLASGYINDAQATALKIAQSDMRDRVLAQIVRRQTSEGRLEDALALARRIEDGATRVGALVRLAGATLASNDRVRAAELLNEAERDALRLAPSIGRAQMLLTIVSSFSAFDTLRAFEVMQVCVKAINDALRLQKMNEGQKTALARLEANGPSPFRIDDLYYLNFESTLAVLARTDFDRALLLAQQLASKETSVIAQLAVCRGGLVHTPSRRQQADEAEAGAGVQH